MRPFRAFAAPFMPCSGARAGSLAAGVIRNGIDHGLLTCHRVVTGARDTGDVPRADEAKTGFRERGRRLFREWRYQRVSLQDEARWYAARWRGRRVRRG